MAYRVEDLAWLVEKLRSHGVAGVIVGSTIVQLELRQKELEDDVDFFVQEPSPLLEEEAYSAIAVEEGWDYSMTALGTPKLIVKTPRGREIIAEFYENILDFYIPPQMLERATSKKISGVQVKLLQLEDYIVLKAKAAREHDVEDLRIIKEYVDAGRLRVNRRKIREALEWIPESERSIAVSKLRETGFLEQ